MKYRFSGDDEVLISDGYYDAYDFEFHIANNPKYRIVCVIAWKEIVLPNWDNKVFKEITGIDAEAEVKND